MGQGLTELEDLSLRFKNNQRYRAKQLEATSTANIAEVRLRRRAAVG